MRTLLIAAVMLPLATGGCVRTAIGLATAPVRAAGKVVDWTTTSQAEADRNRGRKLRHAEQRERSERRALVARCRRAPDLPECHADQRGRAGRAG